MSEEFTVPEYKPLFDELTEYNKHLRDGVSGFAGIMFSYSTKDFIFIGMECNARKLIKIIKNIYEVARSLNEDSQRIKEIKEIYRKCSKQLKDQLVDPEYIWFSELSEEDFSEDNNKLKCYQIWMKNSGSWLDRGIEVYILLRKLYDRTTPTGDPTADKINLLELQVSKLLKEIKAMKERLDKLEGN